MKRKVLALIMPPNQKLLMRESGRMTRNADLVLSMTISKENFMKETGLMMKLMGMDLYSTKKMSMEKLLSMKES